MTEKKLKTQNSRLASRAKRAKLKKEIFGVKPNLNLLHQIVSGYLANQKASTAHTKTRGQVAGSGKKPWKQKGTGRARHGSRRSPIWVGGGVVFGPTPQKNPKKILPQKMRQAALVHALSDRNKNKKIIIAEKLAVPQAKTKSAVKLLALLQAGQKPLIVTALNDRSLLQAIRNIPGVEARTAANLNALDVLRHETLVIEKKAIDALAARLPSKNNRQQSNED